MNIEIANRLVELRKKNGYSQEELAARLGLSRQAVSKWERAEASPDTDNLICLAKLYNVSLDDLLNTSEPVENIVQDVKDKEAEKEKEAETKEEKKPEGTEAKKRGVTMDNGGIHICGSGSSIDIDNSGIHINGSTKSAHPSEDESKEGSTTVSENGGIHLSDEEDSVRFDDNGITVHENGKTVYRSGKKRFNAVKDALFGVLELVASAVYITVCSFFPAFWSSLWVVFLAPIVIVSVPEAIHYRRFEKFNMAVAVVIVYMCLGFYLNLWHPGWAVFFLIPIYYIIAESLDRLRNLKRED